MERTWTCTECGTSATEEAEQILAKNGWWITELGKGLCPPCAQSAARKSFEEILERTRSLHGSTIEIREPASQMRGEARERIRRTRL